MGSITGPHLIIKNLSVSFKWSNNYQKTQIKVARIDALIKDSRLDYTHKLTTQLIRENQTIVIEDLATGNMVKNHLLARAISNANWGKIDRYFPSSKGCSNCGYVVEKLPLNIRESDFPECGSHHDRDINASITFLLWDSQCQSASWSIYPKRVNL